MSVKNLDKLDREARGLRLYRHNARDELLACELVMFVRGAAAINTVLRRAALSGTVAIEPFDERPDYFADVYVDEHNWTQTILLDRASYSSLKNHWMRCRLEPEEQGGRNAA